MQLDPIFSVSEFNEVVARHLRLLGQVTVEGELSQLNVRGQWIYATIKDDSASVEVFGGTFKIRNVNSLEVGMLVKVVGTPGMYQKSGRFSLQADEIMPSGQGALQLAYEKMRSQLEQEGLFAPERKRPLPMFPETIGLLTAPGSQAYLDFVKVSSERMGGVRILFSPVNVQGVRAVGSVIAALRHFNNLTDKPDLLVITRGGGSLEDLAAFNDEQLVREVFGSTIPVVCAIGHEGDVSLAELAADLRASTPSNAAELVFRHRQEVLRELEGYEREMEDSLMGRLTLLEGRIHRDVLTIERHLDHSFTGIDRTVSSFLHQLDGFHTRLRHLSDSVSREESGLAERMISVLTLTLERLTHLEDKLRVLDPRAALRRGYSLLRDSTGKLVTSLGQISIGTIVTAAVTDGTIDASVTAKHKGES